MWFGGGWWAAAIGVIFWLAIIVATILLVRWLVVSTGHGAQEAGGDPMDILKRRYARGEINHDQFEQMKKDLQGGGG